MNSSKNEIMLFHSDHCHACKAYSPFYESLARENLENKCIDKEYNRMDTDLNTLDCAPNYPYTPVFLVYKLGAKETPYIYKNDKFTPQLLKDFCTITCEFALIPE